MKLPTIPEAHDNRVPPPRAGTGSGYIVVAIVAIGAAATIATIVTIVVAKESAQLAIISAITTFALTIVTPLIALLQRQAQQQVRELHLAVNSRLSALLESTAAQASAEGQIAGRQKERDQGDQGDQLGDQLGDQGDQGDQLRPSA